MEFEKSFDGKLWPEVRERIGVMSIDSLDRLWTFVAEKDGYLVAKSKDGQAALLGRMCKREDGKFCVEVVVRAAIENNKLRGPEFWYVDPDQAQQFYDVMQDRISKFQADGDR